jgi:hypothetical protein
MNIKSLSDLQAEYDRMVALAIQSDYNLTPKFERELMLLTQTVKSLGGRV